MENESREDLLRLKAQYEADLVQAKNLLSIYELPSKSEFDDSEETNTHLPIHNAIREQKEIITKMELTYAELVRKLNESE
ncbi:hypothetical protein [Spirosoma agri]|uniref:Uncharacterized protein n=1 Tax=Spirosoma agri TaxID=1987381 RepID=A0A6M0INM0_9BACT|nr:hypothetical protein [Spirosoma agri]NEU69552.1 hypothetical protein [Spirosoma agri]